MPADSTATEALRAIRQARSLVEQAERRLAGLADPYLRIGNGIDLLGRATEQVLGGSATGVDTESLQALDAAHSELRAFTRTLEAATAAAARDLQILDELEAAARNEERDR